MTKSPCIGLTLTDLSDTNKTFLELRAENFDNSPDSNMMIIDTEIGALKSQLNEAMDFLKTASVIYVTGTPKTCILKASNWNGSIYTLLVNGNDCGTELQIGIPPASSIKNAQLVAEAALTIPDFTHRYTSVDTDGDGEGDTSMYSYTEIVISAVNVPTEDLVVSIWGLL